MRCQEAFEAMSATLDGELRFAETQPLRQHLAGCEACRASQDRLRDVDRQLRGLRARPRPLPAALRGRVVQRLQRRPRRMSAGAFAAALGGATAFGALAVLAFAHTRADRTDDALAVIGPAVELFVIGPDGRRTRGESGMHLPPGARVEVAETSAAAASLQLASGARVVLAPGAALSFDAGVPTVAQGHVVFEVPERLPTLEVATQAGSLSISPGRTDVVAERAGEEPEPRLAGGVTVTVVNGTARLHGAGQTLALGPGGPGWLSPGRAPTVAPAQLWGKSRIPKLAIADAAWSTGPVAITPKAAAAPSARAPAAPAVPTSAPPPTGTAVPPPPPRLPGDSCRIALAGDSDVVKACAGGGIKDAKKVMKALVTRAKERGKKFECDSCHKNEDDWTLTDGARDKFTELVTATRT